MKNKRGQALIEFIMILPVILLIFTAIADIGGIIYQKYTMQNDIDVISNYISDGLNETANNYASGRKLTLNVADRGDFFEVTIEKKYKIITPGLNVKLGNPYKIKEKKIKYKKNTNTGESNE